MKVFRYYLCLFAMLLHLQHAVADEELTLKALFISRFVQFADWPVIKNAPFEYCVANDKTFFTALQNMQLKSPAGDTAKLRLVKRPKEALQCQLLVISSRDPNLLTRWQLALDKAPVLIVADTPEAFRSLAVIGLVSEPDGISFRINQTEATERGLVLSSQLLKLAREVI
jgi:hypothetical protein